MERDGMSSEEADNLIQEAKNEAIELIDAGELFLVDDICMTYFGLEPDYLEDLLL